MEKKYFVYKIMPRRATFAQDMTAEESHHMAEHRVYLKEMMEKGMLLTYGPVYDACGVYGLCILSVSGEAEAMQFAQNDPATIIHDHSVYPMNATTAEYIA